MIKITVTSNGSGEKTEIHIDASGPSTVSFSSNSSCSVLSVKDGSGELVYQSVYAHGGSVDVSIEVQDE